MRIRNAGIVVQMLERSGDTVNKSEQSPWRVYALLGSHSFAAGCR